MAWHIVGAPYGELSEDVFGEVTGDPTKLHLEQLTSLKNLPGDCWSLSFVPIIGNCLHNFAPGAGLEHTPQMDFKDITTCNLTRLFTPDMKP